MRLISFFTTFINDNTIKINMNAISFMFIHANQEGQTSKIAVVKMKNLMSNWNEDTER